MFIRTILPAVFFFSASAVVPGSALGGSANLRASSSSAAASASTTIVGIDNEHDDYCDESFPLAPPPPPRRQSSRIGSNTSSGNEHHDDGHQPKRRLVAIPPAADRSNGEYYQTGEYYAPICSDGKRIDLRKLIRCVNDQCFDEEIGHCTYVCSWSKPTIPQTRQPTHEPTRGPVVTEHPLLMDLRSLPNAWRMNDEVRAAIIRYMRDRLKFDIESLGVGMELVELSNPGRLAGKPHALPLKLEVRGPPDISDFALSYIMQAVRDANAEIVKNLKRLDGNDSNTFKDVTVNFSTYEMSDLMEADTFQPSKSPTPAPTFPPVAPAENNVVVLDTEAKNTTGIAWWVWLIIVLVILILCCCCCFCYRYRRDKRDRDVQKNSSSQQKVNLFIQTQNRMMPKKKKKKENKKSLDEDEWRRPPPSRSAAESRRPSHRPRHPRDDQTRKTSRTKRTNRPNHRDRDDQTRKTSRTHKTRQTRRRSRGDETTAVPAPATSIIIHPQADLETIVSAPESQTNVHDDYTEAQTEHFAETAVSALENPEDPPEEGHHAMVLYNPQQQNNGAREPTMYTDQTLTPAQAEPEGDKIMKKQSMFATGALMSEVHREKERKNQAAASRRRSKRRNMGQRLKESFKGWNSSKAARDPTQYYDDGLEHLEPPSDYDEPSNLLMTSEPEGLTSDEMMVEQTRASSTKKKSKKKKKKKQQSGEAQQQQTQPANRRGSLDRLKASFSWRAPGQNANNERAPPIEIDMGSDDSGYDSPSILTNHNPSGQVQTPMDDNPYYRNEDHNDGRADESHQVQASKSSKSKVKKGKSKKTSQSRTSRGGGGMFASFRRRSSAVDGGVSSDDESFHVESEDEKNHRQQHVNANTNAGKQQRRGSDSDSSYESA